MALWVKVSKRGVRVGGYVGSGLFRVGASEGTGGLRVSGSVGGRHGRVGRSIPVGGSKRRRKATYGWLRW